MVPSSWLPSLVMSTITFRWSCLERLRATNPFASSRSTIPFVVLMPRFSSPASDESVWLPLPDKQCRQRNWGEVMLHSRYSFLEWISSALVMRLRELRLRDAGSGDPACSCRIVALLRFFVCEYFVCETFWTKSTKNNGKLQTGCTGWYGECNVKNCILLR